MFETCFLSVIERDDTNSDDTHKEVLEMSSVAQLLFCSLCKRNSERLLPVNAGNV